MIYLTDEQAEARDVCARSIRDGGHWTLHGPAGTGKTTLLGLIARDDRNMIPCAPTAKAASVLSARIGARASTIHKVIYNFEGLDEDAKPTFSEKGVRLDGRTILLDECSMVGEKVATDLLKTGVTIVAFGDPHQLPPVNERQHFSAASHMLRTIHRQALDSPIIRQAHRILTELEYGPDGTFQVASRATADDILAADAILCWRNVTRRALNDRKRELLGLSAGVLLPDEPLMCLRNDYRAGVLNGTVYDLGGTGFARGATSLTLRRNNGGRIHIGRATVEGFSPDYDVQKKDDDWTPFAPAYAMTVHKAQGSEWPSVLVFDEMLRDRSDRRAYLYTAVTRAQQRCKVIRP